jgi:Tol biopolymer transport system component
MGSDCAARVPPDGQWMAYVATEGGKSHVFVRHFRATGGRVQVSDGNGVQPVRSRDGKRLFYSYVTAEGGRSSVAAATVKASGNSLEVVTRERIAALPQTRMFDVTPDGSRILTVQQSDNRQLVVRTNWLPRLRARLAGQALRD